MRKDIAKRLEAEEAERHAEEEEHGPSYRRKHSPRDPAQVYSLRVPAAQLEELRQLADKGTTPSALMREWVLERIAAEKSGLPDPLRLRERLREISGVWRIHSGYCNSQPSRSARPRLPRPAWPRTSALIRRLRSIRKSAC